MLIRTCLKLQAETAVEPVQMAQLYIRYFISRLVCDDAIIYYQPLFSGIERERSLSVSGTAG